MSNWSVPSESEDDDGGHGNDKDPWDIDSGDDDCSDTAGGEFGTHCIDTAAAEQHGSSTIVDQTAATPGVSSTTPALPRQSRPCSRETHVTRAKSQSRFQPFLATEA